MTFILAILIFLLGLAAMWGLALLVGRCIAFGNPVEDDEALGDESYIGRDMEFTPPANAQATYREDG